MGLNEILLRLVSVGLVICCGTFPAEFGTTQTPLGVNAQKSSTIEFHPTTFASSVGEQVEAEMGWIVVPENRSRPQGPAIRIPVVRFRSTAASPGWPIVYLAGGPGGSGIDSAKGAIFPVLMMLRERADVVVFDQRGTGKAEPNLVVSGNFNLPLDVPLDSENSRLRLIEASRKATDEIHRRGIDLSSYNTNENADDVDDLRKALGVEKIAIWGHSYGSHLGLAVLKRHGSHIDRAILGSVNGQDQRWRYPNDLQGLIERMDRYISRIPRLRRQIPSLRETVATVFARLAEKPVTVQLGQKTVVIGKLDVQAAIATEAGVQFAVSTLPLAFGRAQRGDYSALAQSVLGFKTRPVGTLMRYAMHIASGVSPERAAKIERQKKSALFGDAINYPFNDKELIAAWGVADLGDSFRSPLRTNVPTLFLNGNLDGRTSIEDALEVKRGFNNSQHVTVEGASHDFYNLSPQVPQAMIAFIDGKTVPTRISIPIEFRGPDEPVIVAELLRVILEKGAEAGIDRMRQMHALDAGRYVSVQVPIELGFALLRQEKKSKVALDVFKAGVEMFPDHSFLREQLARGYELAGLKDLALQQYRKCLEINSLSQLANVRVKQLGREQ